MKNKLYPWLILVACCGLITVTFGLNNVTGLFFVYMAKDMNTGIGSVSLFLSIINIAAGLVGPSAAKLRQKVGVRITILVPFILCLACYFGVYYATALWQLYLYAVIIGICGGIYGSTLVVELINNWFAIMTGTALGIALAFSGIAGAVLSPIISSMIATKGWRLTYLLIFASLLIVFMVFAFIIIRSTPEELGLKRFGEKAETNNNKQAKEKKEVKIFRKETFMIAFYVTTGACITSLGAHMSGFATNIGLTVSQAAVLVSAVMVGNLTSKILLGIVADSVGGKATASVVFICCLAGLTMLLLLPSSLYLILIAACFLLGASYSAGNVINQACCQDIFGKENAAVYYAWINIPILCCGALMTSIIGYIYDFTGSYKPAIIILLTLLLISFFLLLKVYGQKKKLS